MSRRFTIGLVLLLSIYAMGGIGYKSFSPETPFIDCLYMSVTWIVEAGQTLIVLGEADDVRRGREIAQVI